jgi:RNA polymerase sigma-70 factor (ECF subfamily)
MLMEPRPFVGRETFSNLELRRSAFFTYELRRVDRMQADFELIERARSGDDVAFGQLVSVYRKRILGTISRLIGRPEDVEDVAQDVFLRLYFSLDQLRTAEVFEPWLYRLTVNACYDYLRRQRRRHESRMSDLSEQQVLMADAAAGGKADQDEQYHRGVREFVTSLLDGVSEEDRILLLLKEVEGLSLKELEQIYQVKENALKVRLFRARQRVLKAFEASKGAAPVVPVRPSGG